MNIIFLDVDGVLTSARTGWMNWDIYATSFLKWICEKTSTKIVISSTWRFSHNRKFFVDIFDDQVIHDDWKTPNSAELECRGDEIRAWLSKHPEIKHYVIIDDDSDISCEQIPHHIETDPYNGIIFNDMIKINAILGNTQMFNLNKIKIIQHPNMFSR